MKTDVASMVLGILAVVLGLVPVLGLVLATLALVVGRRVSSGYRTAGVVCGSVGMLIAVGVLLFLLMPAAAPWIYTLF